MVEPQIRKIFKPVVILGDDKKGKPFHWPPALLVVNQLNKAEGNPGFRPGTGCGKGGGKDQKNNG
ncbi:hypothetical protein AGMMS49587_04500 [Spirochaetia bacterium]|nr:hypothetical protein AGMMS49587_04500 [Spirochaetia bacterium]